VLFLFALLIVVAVFSTKLSSRAGIPVLIVFIGLGILVGSDVLDIIYFDDANLTKQIADFLLIFILFTGGFQTKKAVLKSVAAPALGLATVGVLLTALGLGVLIHFVTGLPLTNSLMISSIISSTDAAAVMMVTRDTPVRERVASTLNVESAANDPMAILLTLGFVQIVSGKSASVPSFIFSLLWQFAGGVLVGFILAKVARYLFDHLESENRGYYYVLIIGVILLAYGFADMIKANGTLAVFFMGYWLGNSEFVCKRGVSNFLEGISTFGNVALFLLLGLLAFPHKFVAIWQEGLLIAALMIFVVRPVVVWICTLPFKYSAREKLFISWGGIKGAVPIVLATYPAAYGIAGSDRIFNIIFFTVLLSCVLQGSTMGLLAKWLKITVPLRPHSPYSVELHTVRKSDLDMFEIQVEKGSAAEGLRIRDLPLPRDALISSIVRDERIIPPRGTTSILADDILFVLAPTRNIDKISYIINQPRPQLDEKARLENEIESRR